MGSHVTLGQFSGCGMRVSVSLAHNGPARPRGDTQPRGHVYDCAHAI